MVNYWYFPLFQLTWACPLLNLPPLQLSPERLEGILVPNDLDSQGQQFPKRMVKSGAGVAQW